MARTATPDATRPTYSGSSRDLPWNVMGKDLDLPKGTTVAEALRLSGLDYDVRVEDAYGQASTGLLQAPNHRAIIRPLPDGGEQILAFTGKRFRPIQNRDAFAVADYLVSEFGASVAGAADYRNGGSSLLVVDLGRPVALRTPVGREDVTDLYLMIKNSHDGSGALTFALTGNRIACTNAVQITLANAKRTWKISHTPNAQGRVDLARQSILAAVDYQDALQAAAQALVDQPMVDAEFDKIVARLFPVKADAEGKAAERKREVRAEIGAIYRESDTVADVRGTRWGGYNAVTEWLDHARKVKGSDDKARAVSRAEGALEGPYVRMKESVWKAFSAGVKIPA